MKLFSNNKEVFVQWITFSDSAMTCRIDPQAEFKNCISIDATDETDNIPLMKEKLELLHNALHHTSAWVDNSAEEIPQILLLGYLPYARADRVFQTGNPNGLQTFQSWLAEFVFSEVHIYDPHNGHALDADSINYVVKHQVDCVKETISGELVINKLEDYDYIVAPDTGAVRKAKRLSKYLNVPIMYASKKRNINTGRIESVTLDTSVIVKSATPRVLIVDDILDGGGTFIPIAEELKKTGAIVDLYVTHLIAAKGLEIFKDSIQTIYTHGIVGSYVTRCMLNRYNAQQQLKFYMEQK